MKIKTLKREELRQICEKIIVYKAKLDEALQDRYKVLRNKAEKAPFSKLLNMKVLELAQGFAHLHIPIEKRYANWNRKVHGGVTASLIDTAIGVAVETLINFDVEPIASFDLGVKYLAPAEIKLKTILCCKASWGEAPNFLSQNGDIPLLSVPISGSRIIYITATVIQKPERKKIAEGNVWFIVKGEKQKGSRINKRKR